MCVGFGPIARHASKSKLPICGFANEDTQARPQHTTTYAHRNCFISRVTEPPSVMCAQNIPPKSLPPETQLKRLHI